MNNQSRGTRTPPVTLPPWAPPPPLGRGIAFGSRVLLSAADFPVHYRESILPFTLQFFLSFLGSDVSLFPAPNHQVGGGKRHVLKTDKQKEKKKLSLRKITSPGMINDRTPKTPLIFHSIK